MSRTGRPCRALRWPDNRHPGGRCPCAVLASLGDTESEAPALCTRNELPGELRRLLGGQAWCGRGTASLHGVAAETSTFNKALAGIHRRAEQSQAERLRETFVDSGVATALRSQDHQVLLGRRGTGKTHALKFLESELNAGGDITHYADLRTVGSPQGLFDGDDVPATERAARLLVDMMSALHETLLAAALHNEALLADRPFVDDLDSLYESISSVRVVGDVTSEAGVRENRTDGHAASLQVSASTSPALRAGSRSESRRETESSQRVVRQGMERVSLNFGEIARALRRIGDSIGNRRIWLLLDEWSSVPMDIQPMFAEFLVRCVLPVRAFTVKIAAIQQQTNFRAKIGDRTVGMELGADIAADVDLDEYMVFDHDVDRSIEFFRGLFYRHLHHIDDYPDLSKVLKSESDVVSHGFTDVRAFQELVRAAEGVPRDAINIVSKAALKAGPDKISVPTVRQAALAWYSTDKEGALRGIPLATELLIWIIDEVIKGKKSRGFLVNQKSSGGQLLNALFDARVLHLIRRGYSAQDAPGERYDVWVIDYGAYVDLVNTKNEPKGALLMAADGEDLDGARYVEVPTQDLRSIRRSILDVEAFMTAST